MSDKPRFILVHYYVPNVSHLHGSRMLVDVDELFAVSEDTSNGRAIIEFKNLSFTDVNVCEKFDDVMTMLSPHGVAVSMGVDKNGRA